MYTGFAVRLNVFRKKACKQYYVFMISEFAQIVYIIFLYFSVFSSAFQIFLIIWGMKNIPLNNDKMLFTSRIC